MTVVLPGDSADLIHTGHLTIEHSTVDPEVLTDPLSEILEAMEDVPIPGDEQPDEPHERR
jgi:hypothetical protein